jgi:hypothetical protein
VADLYVAARRILLDALQALGPHRSAITLVGSQAIYLRVGEAEIAVAPATTDGDLALDPKELRDAPALNELLHAAGFARKPDRNGVPLVGIWVKRVESAPGAQVSVDLLMPEEVAPEGGRRAARLEGHEPGSVLKVLGIEAALVDADVMTLASLEPDDRRCFDIRVAGPVALLVGKIHKLTDRTEQAGRLKDKDALDVFRILRGTATAELERRLGPVLADPRSAAAARAAMAAFPGLFAFPEAPGVQMTVRATDGLMAAEDVVASLIAVASDVMTITKAT